MRCLFLLFVICFCLSASVARGEGGAEENSNNNNVNSETGAPSNADVQKVALPRRKYIRKRLLRVANDGNVTTSVSMSVSKSSSGPSSEPIKSRPHLFSRLNRPKLIFHKNGSGGSSSTTLQVPKSIEGTQETTIVETPSASFRQKVRPSFGKAPTNRPIVKATLRKLYRPSTRTTASNGIVEEETQQQQEQVIEEVSATTTTTTTPKPTETSTTTTLEPQTTAPSTTTTTSTTEEAPSSSSPTPLPTIVTEVPKSAVKTTPKNMIIIPVPPSQRKPYHPVIMQVTKAPGVSSTEKPQTRVVTYKLNKMFVPMGIYGKVLPKSEVQAANANAEEAASALNEEQQQQDDASPNPTSSLHSSGITAAIRHKGTSSEELITSDDSSVNHPSTIPLTADDAIFGEAQQNWRPFNPDAQPKKSKGSKQFFDASQVDITTDYKPDISKISLTTQKPQIDQISLTTTEMPSFFGPVGGNGNRRGNYQNQMTHMGPPKPFDKLNNGSPHKSLIETMKSAAANAASSIPGLLHGGLTQLSQLNLGNPFEDVLFGSAEKTKDSQGSASSLISSIYNPSSSASSTDAKKVTIGAPDDETLEYFRKRPHLISSSSGGSSFTQPNYSSGFKPVTVQPSFQKAYYASTTTTPSPSASSTTSSYIRNKYEPTYESHKPSLLLRSPKNFQDSWKKEKDSYVDQLLESSNRYKYASPTSSPFESDTIKSQWSEMNEKYTKNEIDEAKERIYQLFSGPTPPTTIEEMLYMRPPPNLSRSSSSAFQDLLKMFRLGFSYGTSSSTRKPYTRSFGVGNLRSSGSSSSLTTIDGSDDGWRPIKPGGSSSGDSILSFNAAISFGNPSPRPTSSSSYASHVGGTHYSSSSKPYLPKPTQSAYSSSGLKSSSSSGLYLSGPPSYLDGASPSSHSSSTNSIRGHGLKGHVSSSSSHSSKYRPYTPPSSSSSEYSSDIYYTGASNNNENGDSLSLKENLNGNAKYEEEDSYKPPANLGNLYENDPGLEIIPSSLFYKQKEAGIDVGEIAAVLKPSGMNDDVIKAQIPQEVTNVPQISYANGKVPQQFQTLSQLQQYFQTAEPTPQNQVHFRPPLLQIIQQSMDSQREQLGLHKQQAGLHLGHQLSQSFKVPAEQPEEAVAPLASSSSSSNNHLNLNQQYYSAEQSQPQQHHQLPNQFTLSQLGLSGLSLNGLTGHRLQSGQHLSSLNLNHQNLLQQYNRPATTSSPSIEQQLQHHHQLQQQQQPIVQHHHHQQQPTIQHHHHNHQPQVQQHHYAANSQGSLKTSGDSGLGFTDFELPAGVDPDIAALLKAELDKDDIPEEFRKEFQDQEKAKNKKQHAAASAPVPVTAPPPKAQIQTNRRQDVHVKTVFHKPIPISPTLITSPPKSRTPSRPPPNIPKYVLDLARKLRNDKDLQGIVRVTSKKNGGVPVEYLYPVRG